MKRTILLLLTLFLILGAFSSCGHKTVDPIDDQTSSSPSEDTTKEIKETNDTVTTTTTTITEDRITLDETSETSTAIETFAPSLSASQTLYEFETYENLRLAFSSNPDTSSVTDKFAKAHIEDFRFYKSAYGRLHLNLVDSLSDNDRLKIPTINNEPMQLNDLSTTGYFATSVITFMDYYMPWISFNCLYNDEHVLIRTTYPEEILNRDFSSYNTTSDVLKAFKPDAANVDNYTEFDIYTKVYQKQINVSGEEVSAIVYEYSAYDDWYCEVSADFEDWIDVSIYYKDMFIIVRAKPSVLTDEFWQSFSMG